MVQIKELYPPQVLVLTVFSTQVYVFCMNLCIPWLHSCAKPDRHAHVDGRGMMIQEQNRKFSNDDFAFLCLSWQMNCWSWNFVLQYEIGLSYTIMKMEQQNTNSKEGIEVLQQVPFEDEKLGKGQFTSKLYHLQRLYVLYLLFRLKKVYHLQRFVCTFFLD